MSQNHSVTKRKRRHKSKRRTDQTAATMAKLKELAQKAAAAAGK